MFKKTHLILQFEISNYLKAKATSFEITLDISN